MDVEIKMGDWIQTPEIKNNSLVAKPIDLTFRDLGYTVGKGKPVFGSQLLIDLFDTINYIFFTKKTDSITNFFETHSRVITLHSYLVKQRTYR